MGSCLSIGIHEKKKPVVVPDIPKEVERRYDGPALFTPIGRGENKQSVMELKEPIKLIPDIWERLPDDMTRCVLSKLPLANLIHLRYVSKQWNSWILSSTIASPFSCDELVDCRVHPLIIFMYTLILVKDLDNQSLKTQVAFSGRSSLARFFHLKRSLEAHYADVFGWRKNEDSL